jgi:ketosteroid isomerase-like protein
MKSEVVMIYYDQWADRWIESWNSRDLDALLSLYADDVELRAPFAKLYSTGGLVKGRANVRKYWEEYLRRMPNVTLRKLAVFDGHLALAMHCVDSRGRQGIKTVLFNDTNLATFETTCLDRVR